MILIRILLWVVALALLAGCASTPKIEESGISVSEVGCITSVFVGQPSGHPPMVYDFRTDPKVIERLVRRFRSALPELRMVDDYRNADALLLFTTSHGRICFYCGDEPERFWNMWLVRNVDELVPPALHASGESQYSDDPIPSFVEFFVKLYRANPCGSRTPVTVAR